MTSFYGRRIIENFSKVKSFIAQVFKNKYYVIHTHFRGDVPEITLDRSNFCICSFFITFVDVYDFEIELELRYYLSRD